MRELEQYIAELGLDPSKLEGLDSGVLQVLGQIHHIAKEKDRRAKAVFPSIVDPVELGRRFPKKADIYYSHLFTTCRDEGEDEAQAIYERLLNEEKVDHNILEQLKTIETQANQAVPASIQRAQNVLDNLFFNTIEGIATQAVSDAVYVYGSMQYCDPVNLDADVLVAYGSSNDLRRSANFYRNMGEVLDLAVNRLWREEEIGITADTGGHVSLFDIGSPDAVMISKNAEKNYKIADMLAVTISGRPIWLRECVSTAAVKLKAVEISESDPLICALVNQGLAECLQIRRTRRSQAQEFN